MKWMNEPGRQPVSLFQLITPSDSSRGGEVRPVPALAAQCGGPAVRAGVCVWGLRAPIGDELRLDWQHPAKQHSADHLLTTGMRGDPFSVAPKCN